MAIGEEKRNNLQTVTAITLVTILITKINKDGKNIDKTIVYDGEEKEKME